MRADGFTVLRTMRRALLEWARGGTLFENAAAADRPERDRIAGIGVSPACGFFYTDKNANRNAEEDVVKSGFRTAATAVFCAALCCAAAYAQPEKYAVRPVRVIVPWPAGGNIDELVRVLGPKVTEAIGQQLVIENRPGAGGIIGSATAAKAAPDGYTLLVDNLTSHAINPALYGKLPFNTERDFVPIRMMVIIPHILVAHPSLPAKNMKELIALAKAKPGQLDFASFGAGTTSHLAGEMLNMMAHIDLVQVPYKGGPAALADTLAGNVPLNINGIAITIPYVKSGRLRGLAVMTLHRSPLLPDVPTMQEAANLPGFEVASRICMMAPKGTPQAIVDKLSDAMAKALEDPAAKQRLLGMGLEEVRDGAPQAFLPWFHAEQAKWTKVIRETHIHLKR